MHRFALVVLLSVSACRSDGTLSDERPDANRLPDGRIVVPDGATANNICAEATQHADFAWLQQHVFTPSCTGSACHDSTEPTLSLTTGNAYPSLVDQPTETLSGWTRVVPGSPSTSYLMVALGRAPGPPPRSGFMPLEAEPLCAEKLEAVERWIQQGALP